MAEFTSTPHVGRISMEKMVRPFEWVETQADEPVKPKRLLPGHDLEAYIEWGQTANFSSSSDVNDPVESKGGGGTSGFEVIPAEDEDERDDTYTEGSRSTEQIRVENPDDPDTWVEVERITQIEFSKKKGGSIKLVFANN